MNENSSGRIMRATPESSGDNTLMTTPGDEEDLLGTLRSSELLKHLLSEARKGSGGSSVPRTDDCANYSLFGGESTSDCKKSGPSSWWMNHHGGPPVVVSSCLDHDGAGMRGCFADGLLDSILDDAGTWWSHSKGVVEEGFPTDGGQKDASESCWVMDSSSDSGGGSVVVIRDLDHGDDGGGRVCEEKNHDDEDDEDVDSAMVLVPTGKYVRMVPSLAVVLNSCTPRGNP